MVARYAPDRGDLPHDVDVDELGPVLQAVTMDALVAWASSTRNSVALRSALCRRAELVLRGASATSWDGGQGSDGFASPHARRASTAPS